MTDLLLDPRSTALHEHAVRRIFPTLGRVRSLDQVMAALAAPAAPVAPAGS